MKNLFLSISTVLLAFTAHAQISNAYRTQVESIFQVNRNHVTTGLLQDYGFFYTNVEKFNGVRSDTSYLDFSEWQAVYNSLYTYRFNTTAASMPVGATVFDQISNVAIQNAGSIVFAGLHYRYERFKSNAASSNLVYISNNKIYDTPGRPTTPYEVRDAFAMVPLRTVLIGAVHTFLFKPELFYSNTGKTISTLKIDFNDGVGLRTITANMPVAITYSTEGEKKLIFKVTYTDATSVESHTKVDVREIPTQHAQARYVGQNIDEFIFPMAGYTTKPYLGIVGGALVTVEYANPDKVLRKPLIIVSGLDSWKILTPDNPLKNHKFADILVKDKNGGLNVQIDSNTLETFGGALADEDYDLIFVDYDNGTDYIQRNAYMLQSVIQWINATKQNYNGVRQENVILGFSMGGIVARYALRDWEIGGQIFGSHETRLNVSVDSPHLGANIPLGMQAATLHLSGIGIGAGLVGVTSSPLLSFGQVFKKLGRAKDLANAPASRQLLRYQVAGGGNGIAINNSTFNSFMAEYHGMGMPTLYGTRNVAIADGSECATKQPFSEGASFININGKFKTELMANLLSNVSDPLGDLYDYAQYGSLGLPMKTDIHAELKVNALKDRTASEVYKCKLWIKKKILFVININIVLIDKSFSSDNTMLALDNAPGGIKDLSEETDIPLIISRFCHAPTFSTLNIGGGSQPITATDLTAVYSAGSPPSPPKHVPMASFATNPTEAGVSNQIHTQLTLRNSQWLLNEILGTPSMLSCLYVCNDTGQEISINGASVICTSQVYKLNNLPPATPVIWSSTWNSPPNPQMVHNTPNVNELTINNIYAYPSATTLKATINGVCGTREFTKNIGSDTNSSIQYGTYNQEGCYINNVYQPPRSGSLPTTYSPTFLNEVCMAQIVLSNMGGKTVTNTGVNPLYWNYNSSTSTLSLQLPYLHGGIPFTFKISGVGACQDKSLLFFGTRVQGTSYSISPNPATDFLTITANPKDELPESEATNFIEELEYVVKINDTETGELLFTSKPVKGKPKEQIDISKLPKGLYTIQVVEKEGTQVFRFLKE